MTLGEAKARVRALLDETGENRPAAGRLERFFEMGQREIALYYPPYREKEYGEGEARALPEDCVIFDENMETGIGSLRFIDVDDDGVMVRAAMAAGARAIVHAGTGNGSIHEKTEGALMEAAAHGVLVVRASRTPSGMTVEGLAEWQDAGFVPAGTLNPQKARVLAQLSLACGVDPALAFRTF